MSVETLRKWEQTGELVPDRKSRGGTRFYDSTKKHRALLQGLQEEADKVVGAMEENATTDNNN